MIRNSAGEAAIGLPYYRFWVMPHPESQQHPMLLDLEHTGEFVFYAAPEFWTQAEFNDAYVVQQVMASSVFVRPSLIGEIPPNEWHPVAFNQHAAGVFSRHKQIDILRGKALMDAVQADTHLNTEPADARQLALSMSSIVKQRKLKTPEPPESQDPRLTLSYISYLAHCFFHSEVFFRPQS